MRVDLQPLVGRRGSVGVRRVVGAMCLTVAAVVLLLVVFSPVAPTVLPDAAAAQQTGGEAHYGSCAAQPSRVSAPLRWGSEPSTADHICCHNERFAEYFGYWLHTAFMSAAKASEAPITFYDTATGRPLFVGGCCRT
jgi:hypothetical protein